jgi:hypothetical protein
MLKQAGYVAGTVLLGIQDVTPIAQAAVSVGRSMQNC